MAGLEGLWHSIYKMGLEKRGTSWEAISTLHRYLFIQCSPLSCVHMCKHLCPPFLASL